MRGLVLVLLLLGAGDARLHLLQFLQALLEALLGRLQQAVAHLELARARLEFLAALLQAFEHRALARRHRRLDRIDRRRGVAGGAVRGRGSLRRVRLRGFGAATEPVYSPGS